MGVFYDEASGDEACVAFAGDVVHDWGHAVTQGLGHEFVVEVEESDGSVVSNVLSVFLLV